MSWTAGGTQVCSEGTGEERRRMVGGRDGGSKGREGGRQEAMV